MNDLPRRNRGDGAIMMNGVGAAPIVNGHGPAPADHRPVPLYGRGPAHLHANGAAVAHVNGHQPEHQMNGYGHDHERMNGHRPDVNGHNPAQPEGHVVLRDEALLRALQDEGNAENAANGPSQRPRQPRNMQGLLRFALEVTRAEDAPGPSEHGPMAEERRQFLEEALRGMTVNVREVLEKAIKELSNKDVIEKLKADEDVPMEIMLSFNNVTEIIYDIDIANDFGRLGGFTIFPICFACEHNEVRRLAYNLLAELCQNNPGCQRYAVQEGLVEVLLRSVRTERGPVLCKVIYALAALIRNYLPAADLLFMKDGCEVLIDILQNRDNEERALVKAMFLTKYIVEEHSNAREELIQRGLIEVVLSFLGKEVRDCSEYALEILLALVKDKDPVVMAKLGTPEAKGVIEDHKALPELDKDWPEYNFCSQLLQVLG